MVMLSLFVAGQVVLALGVWVFVRVSRREANLGGRLAAIREITHRPSRAESARNEDERAAGELRDVDVEVERARARGAQFDATAELPTSIAAYVLLTILLFEGEAGLALLLNVGAGFAEMAPEVAAFVSPLVAAALFAVLHLVLGALIEIGAAHRPQRLLRRARMGAAVGTAAVIVAAWAVLSGRSIADPQVIETVVSAGLLMLALVLSVAGAFASLVVTIGHAERAGERHLTRLERRKTALERHLESVRREMGESGDSIDRRPPSGLRRAVVNDGAARVLLAAVLLATPNLACADRSASADTTRADTGAPVPTPTSVSSGESRSQAVGNECDVLIDATTSVERAAREDAIERLTRDLDTIATVFGCSVLRFSAFGDAPLPIREVALPATPSIDSCTEAAATAAGPKPSDVLYPAIVTARLDAVRRQCEASARKRLDDKRRERDEAIAAARSAWREVAATAARGSSCTALDYVVGRAIVRSRHALVITDGRNTCDTGAGSPPGLPLTHDRSLTFLLVAPAGPNAGARSREYAAHLERQYTASRVLFMGELTPTTWRTLTPRS